MPNKRHQPPTPPRAPSLAPDTGESRLDPGDAPAAPPPVSSSPSSAPPAASEAEVLKDRHLRLAAEYDNFRKRTIKERTETWTRAQADLVSRLADALDDLSRFAHVDPTETDPQTLHDGIDLGERKVWKGLGGAGR